MLDRWGQVICTSLKWSNHPHLEIVLDKRSYKWNPCDGWEQPANLLKTLLLQLCLQQVPGVPSHMALPNCQMAKVWPQYLTEIPLKCFSLLSALYSQSGVWESLPFFTAARNRNYNKKKTSNQLSEGWVNFENRIKRLEATTYFLCMYDRSWMVWSLHFIEPSKKNNPRKGLWQEAKRMKRCLSRAQKEPGVPCDCSKKGKDEEKATGCCIDLMEKLQYSKPGS